MIKTFGQWTVYCFARIVICFLQSVRIETCDSICRWLAWLSYRVLRLRRKIIDENIVHAFPHLSEEQRQALALGMWHHVFLLVCELAQVPRKIHETNWREFVDISYEDCREQVSQMLSVRPVVVFSGHFGNFELGGFVTGMLGFPYYTVARIMDQLLPPAIRIGCPLCIRLSDQSSGSGSPLNSRLYQLPASTFSRSSHDSSPATPQPLLVRS